MFNFFLPMVALAASIGISFGQVASIIPVGEEFKVPVSVFSAENKTLGADAVILYDPKILWATRVNNGNLYPDYPENLKDIDNVQGRVRFTGSVGFGKPITANGLLGNVSFRSKKPGATQVSFYWKNKGTDDINIVPSEGGLDLLTAPGQPVNVQIREATQSEKVVILIKRIFSFDYLNF